MSEVEGFARRVLWLAFLLILGYAIYLGYGWFDSVGLIPHREETVISARSDWLVGESKECVSMTPSQTDVVLSNKEIGSAMSSVSCDGGAEHNMVVRFYGRRMQPEHGSVIWRCTKEEASFTCYQTGGTPAKEDLIRVPPGYVLQH
jgi:hypothetical protein